MSASMSTSISPIPATVAPILEATPGPNRICCACMLLEPRYQAASKNMQEAAICQLLSTHAQSLEHLKRSSGTQSIAVGHCCLTVLTQVILYPEEGFLFCKPTLL